MQSIFFEDRVTQALVARQKRFERWTRIAVGMALVLFYVYHCASARLADDPFTLEVIGVFLLFALIMGVVFTVAQWALSEFFFLPTRYGTYGRCARRMERWARSTIPHLRCKVWKKPAPMLLGMETESWRLILDGPATGYNGIALAGHQILDVFLTDQDPAKRDAAERWPARLFRRLLPAYHAATKRRWWLEIRFTLPDQREPACAVYPFGRFGRDAENWRSCILSLKN